MTPPSEPRVTPEMMRGSARQFDEAGGLCELSHPQGASISATLDSQSLKDTAAMLRQGADAIERWKQLKAWPDRTVELEAEMALLEREP